MKKIVAFVFICIGMVSMHAQELESFFTKADRFFETYVSDGRVAYTKIDKRPNRSK